MAYLTVDGVKQIYYEHYRGSGRPVVLVHGWGMSVRVWDTVLPALLGAGHEVVSLDHRACGRSDKDFDTVSIDAIGSDVARLVNELSLDGVVLNGWSLGGAVVVDAAAKLQDVGGLVLTGGATPKYLQGDGWAYGGTPDVLEQTLTMLSDTRPVFLRALSEGVMHKPEPATVEWMWEIFMQTSARADDALRDLGAIDQRKIMADLSIPALVVHGVHDAIVPYDIGREAAQLLPNGRLVDFAESGHAPFLEETAKYRSELLGFLAELG